MSQNDEQTTLNLPVSWKPFYREDLIRIGSEHDGGYVVTENAVNHSDFLVSLGIANDWTFEEEFNRIRNCDIHCYDHSISFNYFLEYAVRNFAGCFFPRQLKNKIWVISLALRYKTFFRDGRKHFKEKIGNNPKEETNFEKIFSRIPDDKEVFLKMDIEGSEYQVLNDLDKYYRRISGIAIEFHDVDTLYDSVHKHIEKLKEYFDIVHVHINNCGASDADKIPCVIEVTFENKKIFSGKPRLSDLQYPLPDLDNSNSPYMRDYRINFSG
ncbi:MAG: hypothetical protein CVU55_16060 [Deltaproteobacteria bacterium HGW-Deltaproteobacteria-13]|jgi:hypothetical protein|nr:MAG: hypothetical protein CVU55_16060 [Deltaproteobacteria bacterium HGW-Deltaproteobacteria-13]